MNWKEYHKDNIEFKNYRDKINKGLDKNNIFIEYYGSVYGFIDFYKNKETKRYMYINDAMEFLAYSDMLLEEYYPHIIKTFVSYSSTLEEGNNKISKITIFMILRYISDDDEVIKTLFKHENCINYDDIFQTAIDMNNFDLVNYIFDKVKITNQDYDAIIRHAQSPIVERLLDKCASIGLYPNEDNIYKLLGRGIKIPANIPAIHNVVNDNNIKYILIKLERNMFDFKKERSKHYKFNDLDKEKIKTAIFENINIYNDKNLEAFAKIFDITYDKKCFKIFADKSTDHKIFKYLINLGIKPDYKSLYKIVRKLYAK